MAVLNPRIHCLALAILIVGGILMLSSNHQAWAAQISCQNSVLSLVSNCSNYVMRKGPKVKPSAACCGVVKNVDVPCVCSLVTKEIEKVVDMAKVVYVAGYCGKKLAPGTKCGSYKVPAA